MRLSLLNSLRLRLHSQMPGLRNPTHLPHQNPGKPKLICHHQKISEPQLPAHLQRLEHVSGIGTQKIEAELIKAFPEAVSHALTKTPPTPSTALKRFTKIQESRSDILVGTQMIKGLPAQSKSRRRSTRRHRHLNIPVSHRRAQFSTYDSGLRTRRTLWQRRK